MRISPTELIARIAKLKDALANTGSFSLLNVHLDPYDRSPALERLAQRLSQIV